MEHALHTINVVSRQIPLPQLVSVETLRPGLFACAALWNAAVASRLAGMAAIARLHFGVALNRCASLTSISSVVTSVSAVGVIDDYIAILHSAIQALDPRRAPQRNVFVPTAGRYGCRLSQWLLLARGR